MDSLKLKYRPHLDGLRGLAVLAVIGFHAFPQAMPAGFIGVDIFFVISGYLISSILYADFGAAPGKGIRVIGNFYARRVRRIFPALLVVLLACYALGFFLLLPNELAKLSLNMAAGAGFCLNLVLAGQTDYFNSGSGANPLLHLWSLGIEEQFYLVWPLLIWGAIRCRIRILPAAVFLAACSYCWNAQRFESFAAAAFFLPQMRLWELLLGAIAAAITPSSGDGAGEKEPAGRGCSPAGRLAAARAPLGLALIGAGLLLVRKDLHPPNAWTLLPTVGTALVVGSSGSAWLNRRVLSQPILVGIGLISYPLYLWHWPLLSFVRLGSASPNSALVRISALAGAGALAGLTYRFIETPVRHGRRRARTVFMLAGAMTVVAGLGYFSLREGGFPSRFPPLLGEIAAFEYKPDQAVRQGTYFLMGDQDETKFKKDPKEMIKGRPTLYLWGDSHAAALYPGLSEAYGAKYNIVQRTAALTPPFMAERFNPGNARQISQFVFDSIKRDHPEFVMLEADWQEYDWPAIAGTIEALKAAGIPHIVLVGPVPQWIGSLPQQLYNYVRRHRSEPVPVRMRLGEDPAPLRIDPSMAALAERLGVEYISPCKILENQDGFLVRTGETAETLTTFDSSHLTVNGSRFLVAHFPKL